MALMEGERELIFFGWRDFEQGFLIFKRENHEFVKITLFVDGLAKFDAPDDVECRFFAKTVDSREGIGTLETVDGFETWLRSELNSLLNFRKFIWAVDSDENVGFDMGAERFDPADAMLGMMLRAADFFATGNQVIIHIISPFKERG